MNVLTFKSEKKAKALHTTNSNATMLPADTKTVFAATKPRKF
jgi:hypothetical protein